MKFDVPNHAQFRIMERGIDVDDAKKVVKYPDIIKAQAESRYVATKKLSNGRTLSIVYHQKSKNQFVIITGYYEN